MNQETKRTAAIAGGVALVTAGLTYAGIQAVDDPEPVKPPTTVTVTVTHPLHICDEPLIITKKSSTTDVVVDGDCA